jgi:hypothetical protein
VQAKEVGGRRHLVADVQRCHVDGDRELAARYEDMSSCGVGRFRLLMHGLKLLT